MSFVYICKAKTEQSTISAAAVAFSQSFVGLTHEEIADRLRISDCRDFVAVLDEPIRGVLAHEAFFVRLWSASKGRQKTSVSLRSQS